MFEQFTDRARKAMALANQEALRLKHDAIGVEHLLLGLVEEGSGVAANVLKHLGVDLRRVRLEIEKLTGPGSASVQTMKLPLTPAARGVVERAIQEARDLEHGHVGTEHILLGLLGEQEGAIVEVLARFGLSVEFARHEVLDFSGRASPTGPSDSGCDKPRESARTALLHSRLTDRACKAISLANEAAYHLGRDAIETEHVLFGLLGEDWGVAARVLKEGGVTFRKLRSEVERLCEHHPPAPMFSWYPLSARTQTAIEHAAEEAGILGQDRIDTGHLLLGLLREQDSAVGRVLIGFGLSPEETRRRVLEMLMSPRPAGSNVVTDPSVPKSPDMSAVYRRFTHVANSVMRLSRQESKRLGFNSVEPGTILLGLFKDRSSFGLHLLERLNIDVHAFGLEIERWLTASSPEAAAGDAPLAPQARKVIEYADEESLKLGHSHLGTEHLLLGLCRDQQSPIGQILVRFNLTAETIRQAIIAELGDQDPPREERSAVPNRPQADAGAATLIRFTECAHGVMATATNQARRFEHNYVGTEHILLGLVVQGTGSAAKLLRGLGADLRKVRLEVEKGMYRGQRRGSTGRTPRHERVIEYAAEEARKLGLSYVNSVHLLLGLLREPEGAAARVLTALGITLDRVRQTIESEKAAADEQKPPMNEQASAAPAPPPDILVITGVGLQHLLANVELEVERLRSLKYDAVRKKQFEQAAVFRDKLAAAECQRQELLGQVRRLASEASEVLKRLEET